MPIPIKKRFQKANYVKGLELEQKAMELRIRGQEPREIARLLGVPTSHITKALKRGLGRSEAAGERTSGLLRQVEAERSNQMIAAWWGQAVGDEVRMVTDFSTGRDVPVKLLSKEAADVVLSYMKLRINLFGLDAPKKVEQKIETNTTIDIELSNLLDGKKSKYRTIEGTMEAIQSSTAGELHKAIESCREVPAEVGTDSAA